MTPQEFKEARQSLGLSQLKAGVLIGLEGKPENVSRTVRRWETGATALPRYARQQMQMMLDPGWRPDDWPASVDDS